MRLDIPDCPPKYPAPGMAVIRVTDMILMIDQTKPSLLCALDTVEAFQIHINPDFRIWFSAAQETHGLHGINYFSHILLSGFHLLLTPLSIFSCGAVNILTPEITSSSEI